MRAAKLKEHPGFQLMKQTDVQNLYYMQMPLWLFYDPRYSVLSLDAKVAYTFLLNRFQLSRRNGWVNDAGEVFVIFPRRALANELRVCEQRITAAFKSLVELELIWEKRCGRGEANQIYLAAVEPIADPEYVCAPFFTQATPTNCDSRNTESASLDGSGELIPYQEAQKPILNSLEICVSRNADFEVPEAQISCPKKKEESKQESSYLYTSPSVSLEQANGPTDEEAELIDILDTCELWCFDPGTAKVFENAVERLYYSDSFRLGNATLPKSRIRAKLHLLNAMVLREVECKLHANLKQNIKNSTAYTMATLLNCIAESESDLMVDPYLNSLRAPPERS